MFNSDLYKVGQLLLPASLRQTNVIAWMKVFLSVIKSLMATFTGYRSEQLFFIAHNSQIIYLEHILNYRFNPDGNLMDADYVGNGIYIEDGGVSDDVYIYNTRENADDTFLHNSSEAPFTEVYLYNNAQFTPWTGFIIWVPDTFTIDENELKALVNRLKLAGKEYTIIYYTI